jgi:RNA polymerase sigma factor (sigma-70 family)
MSLGPDSTPEAGEDCPRARTSAAALAAFWRDNQRTLLRICLRWTRGNASEAEELLGEACLHGIEALCGGAQVLQPLPWWATIISNLARDKLRSRMRRPFMVPVQGAVGGELEVADRAVAIDDYIYARQRLRTALSGLGGLPASQRYALVTRSLGGDYAEIACALGTSTVNARKLVQTARDELKRLGGSEGSGKRRRASGLQSADVYRTGADADLPAIRPALNESTCVP